MSARTPATDAWIRQSLGIAAPGGGPTPAPPPATPFVQSRLAWIAARKKVESDLVKLHGAIAAVYQGHGAAEHLEKAFKSKVEGVLGALDHSLSDKLDEVNRATDAATHAKLVGEAQQIIRRYEAYVAGEPIIAKLDHNPFVPIAIAQTLTATLEVLIKAVR